MTKIRRKRLKVKAPSSRRRRKQRERIITVAISAVCCLFTLYALGSFVARRQGGLDAPSQRLGSQSQNNEELLANARERLARAQVASGGGGKLRNSPGGGRDRGEGRGEHGGRGEGRGRDRGGGEDEGNHGLISMRRALEDPDFDPSETEKARAILSASLNLVDVEVSNPYNLKDDSYSKVIGHFCPMDFSAQKEKPPELPMFKDVVGYSKCNKARNIVRVDLREAVELAREFDEDNVDNLPNVLDLKGVVFHESRCGSTLAANSMMALNPIKNRVYSESSPPIAAIRGCGEDYSNCSIEASAKLLKDIIYMMGRSNDPNEENLFFKFQSITTRTMETFRTAFPTTPWIFMYREPIEVLMSQLDVPNKAKANCVRAKKSSPMIKSFIDKTGYHFDEMISEEFCAIHMATLCESALRNLEDANGVGMAVNYHPELVHDFLDTIFPKHFRVPVDGAGRERVLKISGTYSKNRGQHAEGKFQPDSEEKEKKASEEIKDAAKDFLRPSFDELQESEYNIRPSDSGDDAE